MRRIKKLLKKVSSIVNNINEEDLISKIEIDEQEKQEYDIQFLKMNVSFDSVNKYMVYNNVKNNNYKKYNDYDVEVESWTSLKAS